MVIGEVIIKQARQPKQLELKGGFVPVLAALVTLVLLSAAVLGVQGAFMDRGKHILMIASATFRTTVTAAQIDLPARKVRNGKIVVKNITLGSRPGFSVPRGHDDRNACRRYDQTGSPAIILRPVTISGLDLYLDIAGGRTNLTQIREDLDAKAAVKYFSTPGRPPHKIILQDIRMENVRLHVTAQERGSGGTAHIIPLPEITIAALGRENGEISSQALKVVYDAIIKEALLVAARAGYLNSLSPEGAADVNRAIGTEKSTIDLIDEAVKDNIRQMRRERELLVPGTRRIQ